VPERSGGHPGGPGAVGREIRLAGRNTKGGGVVGWEFRRAGEVGRASRRPGGSREGIPVSRGEHERLEDS
jgi:hypothetical protein